MRVLKLSILVLALAALGAGILAFYPQDSSLDGLIERAEAGSQTALDQLEALSAAGELAEHSDLVGAAASRVSQAVRESDPPKGFVSRWHRLFFATDPLQNASEQTRTDFVRSLFLLEPIVPAEVLAGREYSVGRRVVGTLGHDELEALSDYSLVESLQSVTANGTEFWPSGRGSTATRPLALGKGATSGSSFKTVLLNADQTLAPREEMTLKMVLNISVEDKSTDPPTVFASWTEELVATPKVKTVFAQSPVQPRAGEAGIETVLALLGRAEAGDEGAAEELVRLGKNGELRPHADELGSLAVEGLRADWRPRVKAYFEEHGWETHRIGAEPLPEPDEHTSLLIGLFFLADPVTTASQETWMEVARAGVSTDHHVDPGDGGEFSARLRIKAVTVLVRNPSLEQVSGLGIALENVEFDGESWPLRMTGSQRITSVSPAPAAHWRAHLSGRVWEQNRSHGFTTEMAARLSQRREPILNDLRTHLELSLLHDEDISLATWAVTVERAVSLAGPRAP